MHMLGISGMPRRILDYPEAYAGWNMIASFGAGLSMLAGKTTVFMAAGLKFAPVLACYS